jgi:hypothetical protein
MGIRLMWIHFDDKELEILEQALSRKVSFHLVSSHIEETKAAQALLDKIREAKVVDPVDALYRAAVKTSDDLEVDDDAIVSTGADPGAWVHAWVWVSNEDAGVTFVCESCDAEWTLDERDPDSGCCKACARAEEAEDNVMMERQEAGWSMTPNDELLIGMPRFKHEDGRYSDAATWSELPET